MRIRNLLLSAAAFTTVSLACDLQKVGSQFAANKVMVATLLTTPPLAVDPMAIAAGGDGGVPDGGWPQDAGYPADGGAGYTVPSQTLAFAFIGTRSSEGLASAPDPVAQATVTVRPLGGAAVTLHNDGKGVYSQSSGLTYESGKTYDFEATVDGETFVGEVKEVPAAEKIDTLHPPRGYVDQGVNQQFTFTRPPAPSGQERTLGFVSVYPLGVNGEKGDATYSNVPSTPADFLKLVALPADWKQSLVVVPGTAFPRAQSYLLVFQSAKSGGAKSSNLFVGSAVLAGAADVALIRAR